MKRALTIMDNILVLVHRYILELIAMMFLMLFAFWTVGYFANSLYGYHFDLQSCWGGFSAIGGAGVLAAIKYCTDSWKNSPEGLMPGEKVKEVIETITKDKDGNKISETVVSKEKI